MKKLLFLLVAISCTLNTAFAKKVKFAVDMTGIPVNITGMHISGDFQTAAGFSGGDWMSNTTSLTQEGSTGIYSIIVNIPAFAKYEYKFINGDQWYEAEFVPLQSRVGYNFNDNRWVYVDSISNDTSFAGPILFSGNAPAGLNLVRFIVDMQEQSSIPAAGAHVAGSFQGWDPLKTRLYSFENNVYEIISFVVPGNYEYKFINGNTIGEAETVPGACAAGGNRLLQASQDTVLGTICFASCGACGTTDIPFLTNQNKIKIYPNPSSYSAHIELKESISYNIALTDANGRIIRNFENFKGRSLEIHREDLDSGIYFIKVQNTGSRQISTEKLIFE